MTTLIEREIVYLQDIAKTISKEVICRIYDIFEGHTWYLQNIFHRLFNTIEKGEEATLTIADQCLRYTVNSYKKLFQETINLLSARQREMLYAVGKAGKATEITSGAFVNKHALVSSSSAQTAARQLLGKEILTKEDNAYMVYDRFMGLWLSDVYGMGYNL